MKKRSDLERLHTGVPNLDDLLRGGLPQGGMVVIAGPPGAGKTILSQQICFHRAATGGKTLYFSTLSEPTAKTLRFLRGFDFFDPSKLDELVHFVDLGIIIRSKGLEEAVALLMKEVRRVEPALVVIDSFRVFSDLAATKEQLRKFSYEIAINLMAWETTTLLLGEYSDRDIATNPLFSIVDGLIKVHQRDRAGEMQRLIQIAKMRGTDHSRDEHPFAITKAGIEVFPPRVIIQREPRSGPVPRLRTHISKLDDLLGKGIPHGSSLLVAGVAGTGKTVLLLEFLYRGALAGEKGILFSFEETDQRLRDAARGLGWKLDEMIEKGLLEIVFVPQPAIMVEAEILRMQQRIHEFGATRVGVDSLSVFLHKLKDPQLVREKVYEIASIIQNANAVGFLATDIPYGKSQISRYGVEETVVDGVLLLTATEEGYERQRYLEVYKLRNTAHLDGRHSLRIAAGGMQIYPRYDSAPTRGQPTQEAAPRARSTKKKKR
jgi:circadian clock protein KaiC